MTGSKHRPRGTGKQDRGRQSPPLAGRRKQSRTRPESTAEAASIVSSKRPIARFVIVLVVLLCLFNYAYYVEFVKGDLLRPHLETTAQTTGFVLRALGNEVRVSGTSVASPLFSMEIDTGCDALQAVAFFVFAVIAAPLRMTHLLRIASIVLGTVVLMCANLVRISSLYYVGAYFPKAFETIHIDVWQTLFIFLPICLWLVWAWWAIRRLTRVQHVGA